MDGTYWLKRWQKGETGWHQSDVEPALIQHFSTLKPTRVFVPLCGKTKDLTWLASRGHVVIGVELSDLASQAYFEENGISFETFRVGRFIVYHGGNVTILQGDIFDLQPNELGRIGAVYDRAALIALPAEIRTPYAARMTRLMNECAKGDGFSFLQIVLARSPHDQNGPPFSVPLQELESLYGSHFEISLLKREQVQMGDASNALTYECAYRLKPRESGHS